MWIILHHEGLFEGKTRTDAHQARSASDNVTIPPLGNIFIVNLHYV